MSEELRKEIAESLIKAMDHLQWSYDKVIKFDLSTPLDNEKLETLESFSSRFARFSDVAIRKYFRALILEQDPAFRGSVIDILNLAEKNGWIDDAQIWRRIRELRNVAAHEYSADEYVSIYRELIKLAPSLLGLSVQP